MISNKISILHIAPDSKFVNAANYAFEKAFPGCNQFIIPIGKFKRNLTQVKATDNVKTIRFSKNIIKSIARITQAYDCIMLHGMTDFHSSIFLSAKDKNKFVGILWGAELYTDENFPNNGLYGKLTSEINIKQPNSSLIEKLKSFIRPLIYDKPLTDTTRSAAIKLSYFSSLHEEEFELFKAKQIIPDQCKHIPLNYNTLEYINKGFEQSLVNGNDILLGNSATPTNNHLEAFQILKELNINNRNIVVPLSYGNTFYADHIQSKGVELFNDNLITMRNVLPLNEYTKRILSCGIVIMNHFRQQAMGNTILMLWLGSKVYLNESNTFFQYLKRIGINVFSIENELVKDNINALNNLSEIEMLENRRILKKFMGEEYGKERLRDSLLNSF